MNWAQANDRLVNLNFVVEVRIGQHGIEMQLTDNSYLMFEMDSDAKRLWFADFKNAMEKN